MQVNNVKELGELIREIRKKNGFTQQKLASLANVGTRFISELERGKETSQIGKTLKITNLLGMEVHISERR